MPETEELTASGEIRDPKAVLDALERAKSDAKHWREAHGALQVKMSELESDDTNAKVKGRLVRSEAKSRLLGMGIKDADRLLKYIDVDAIELDDEELKGLDTAIENVRKDLPELFDPRKRSGGAIERTNDAPDSRRSVTDRQAAALLGR
jgi:hypothetical protein